MFIVCLRWADGRSRVFTTDAWPQLERLRELYPGFASVEVTLR